MVVPAAGEPVGTGDPDTRPQLVGQPPFHLQRALSSAPGPGLQQRRRHPFGDECRGLVCQESLDLGNPSLRADLRHQGPQGRKAARHHCARDRTSRDVVHRCRELLMAVQRHDLRPFRHAHLHLPAEPDAGSGRADHPDQQHLYGNGATAPRWAVPRQALSVRLCGLGSDQLPQRRRSRRHASERDRWQQFLQHAARSQHL